MAPYVPRDVRGGGACLNLRGRSRFARGSTDRPRGRCTPWDGWARTPSLHNPTTLEPPLFSPPPPPGKNRAVP